MMVVFLTEFKFFRKEITIPGIGIKMIVVNLN